MPFRWLHISDLHLKSDEPYEQDLVLRAFMESLPLLMKRHGSYDAIFVTGDIGYSGQKQQYEHASSFFDKLLEVAQLDRKRLFVVPGNHDVDRSAGKGLARTLQSEDESIAYFDPKDALPHLRERKSEFGAWFDNYFDGFRAFSRNSSMSDVEVLSIAGVRLAIVRADTSIFSKDDADEHRLWLGRRCVDDAIRQLTCANFDKAVLLGHHPLYWLADEEQAHVRASVRSGFDFFLHGHLHTPDFESAISSSGALTTHAAGALYQTRKFPNRASIVDLTDSGYEVTPLRYEDAPRPAWTIDPSFYPGESDYRGRITWSLSSGQAALPSPPVVDSEGAAISALAESRAFEADLFKTPKGTLLYAEPRLRTKAQELSDGAESEAEVVEVQDIVQSSDSYVIRTKSEFGATTLCKRFVHELESQGAQPTAYKDARSLPNYRKKLAPLLAEAGFSTARPGVLVLDNFDFERDERLLNEIASLGVVHRTIAACVDRGVKSVVSVEERKLAFDFRPIFLWQISRHDIRRLAAETFDTADQPLLSTIVNKVYQDLLQLRIPLTPVTVIMYLRIIAREGEYNPLNRVDILDRFLRDSLTKPTDIYGGSFNFRNKMDVLSSLAKALDAEGLSTFDEKFWHEFCASYKSRTLTEFDASELLGELIEAKILLKFKGYIFFRFTFWFTFFVGRYYAARPRELADFIVGERYLRTDLAVIDVITGLNRSNGEVVEALAEKLEGLVEDFSSKYAEQSFDPMAAAQWLESPEENEKLWEPVAKQIEAGPRSASEIDEVKSSVLAESRTSNQEVTYAEFEQLERKLFAVAYVLRDAVRNSDDIDASLKIRAVDAYLKAEFVAYQIGMIFLPIIARTQVFIWGAIAFVNFKDSVEESKLATVEGSVTVADDIAVAVAHKAADDIGTKKLGPVFKARAKDASLSGFSEYLNFCCLLAARSDGWADALEATIRSTDKNSYYLYAMLRAVMYFLSTEIGTATDRDKARRLTALIRAKRDLGKQSPGEKLVNRVLRFMNKNDAEGSSKA